MKKYIWYPITNLNSAHQANQFGTWAAAILAAFYLIGLGIGEYVNPDFYLLHAGEEEINFVTQFRFILDQQLLPEDHLLQSLATVAGVVRGEWIIYLLTYFIFALFNNWHSRASQMLTLFTIVYMTMSMILYHAVNNPAFWVHLVLIPPAIQGVRGSMMYHRLLVQKKSTPVKKPTKAKPRKGKA